MATKILYLMCGPAGGGKSTWVREHAVADGCAVVSRDAVRFSMVKENEPYFSQEPNVYKKFCEIIHNKLADPGITSVYADATHLTQVSRAKLLKDINYNLEGVEIWVVVIKPPLEVALARNAQRTGRACVPESAIRNMYKSFQNPINDEYEYDGYIYGKENEDIWEGVS